MEDQHEHYTDNDCPKNLAQQCLQRMAVLETKATISERHQRCIIEKLNQVSELIAGLRVQVAMGKGIGLAISIVIPVFVSAVVALLVAWLKTSVHR